VRYHTKIYFQCKTPEHVEDLLSRKEIQKVVLTMVHVDQDHVDMTRITKTMVIAVALMVALLMMKMTITKRGANGADHAIPIRMITMKMIVVVAMTMKMKMIIHVAVRPVMAMITRLMMRTRTMTTTVI
jgi:hypothetical protein